MRHGDDGSSRHSSTVRSTTSAPGNSPCTRRCDSVRVSMTRAPRSIAATSSSGVSRCTPTRLAASTSSIPTNGACRTPDLVAGRGVASPTARESPGRQHGRRKSVSVHGRALAARICSTVVGSTSLVGAVIATRTFLFVDQVGSTEQLTLLGDAAAQRVRRALFDLLRQATEVEGGQEVDFTGDGLFCAFDGAAEAVDAAVGMQQLVWSFNGRQPERHRVLIRAGLNSGEPLESEGGGYFGTAVVVAARLCSAAGAGQVLVSPLVRGLVEPRGVHEFRPVGRLELKGVPEPVEVAAVAWPPDVGRAPLPPPVAAARTGPFVGRRHELEAIDAAWEQVLGGGRRLVTLSGDRG